MIDVIEFFVAGEPVPQGSAKGFVINGKPVITHANKNTMRWRERVAHEAQAAAQAYLQREGRPFLQHDRALTVSMTFTFVMPKSYPKCYDYAMTKRPDADKLLRAILDGITDILCYDDCCIDRIKEATKVYGDTPGLNITVESRPDKVPNERHKSRKVR